MAGSGQRLEQGQGQGQGQGAWVVLTMRGSCVRWVGSGGC